jgi:hypothetical protein
LKTISSIKTTVKKPRNTSAEDFEHFQQLVVLNHTHKKVTDLFLMETREVVTDTQTLMMRYGKVSRISPSLPLFKKVELTNSLRVLSLQRQASSLLHRRRGRVPRVKLDDTTSGVPFRRLKGKKFHDFFVWAHVTIAFVWGMLLLLVLWDLSLGVGS